MRTIGVVGLLLAISCSSFELQVVNAFVASMISAAIVIITNAMPFWGTFSGAYANSMKGFAVNYFSAVRPGRRLREFMRVI
jgi:hypothetical protein